MLSSILETGSTGAVTMESFIICSLASIVLGILGAIAYMYRNSYSKGFVVTLAVLPLMVQVVIALVNGNLGAGVAVAGAFSLIRFRSAQGGGRELGAIFLAMAIGLATGMGYIGIAVMLTAVIALMQYVLMTSRFGDEKMSKKQLRISIPENLNYEGAFDEIFEKYLLKAEMTKVKTSGMGSVYDLYYEVTLKENVSEKELMDEIRCRNGNLPVMMGRIETVKQEL